MAIPDELFGKGDVYIDFPQEEVMFYFQKETGKIFRKFYWRPSEDEVPHNSSIFVESRIYGALTTRENYLICAGHGQQNMPPAEMGQ
jgi:hypothetical protein